MNNSRSLPLSVNDSFARLFVIAIDNKMNLDAFTNALEKTTYLQKLEDGEYDDCFNESYSDLFFEMTSNRIKLNDSSYMNYNDAFWCGYSYYRMHQIKNKPFSYLFLKLPLSKLVDLYDVYHEMDTTSLVEYFDDICEKKTILRLLCENRRCSLSKLAKATKISVNTLMKYNASDEVLYKASFQNIYKIAKYFDKPFALFVK